MLKNSKKLQAIDFIIQKRLEQIFKGPLMAEDVVEQERKKSPMANQQQIYQLNQTAYSYDNDDNLQSRNRSTQELLQNNRPMTFLNGDTFKESITLDYQQDEIRKTYQMKILE